MTESREARPPGTEPWPTIDAQAAPPSLAGPDAGGSGPRGASPDAPPLESTRAVGPKLVVAVALLLLGFKIFGPYLFLIVAALVVSIVLHEFGHFWTARRSGMKVTEFFVGFGPRLWSFRRGEVEYGVKAIPAGAYVRIVGMNHLEEVDPADEARTYRAKGTFARLATVLAGPAMNLAIAFALFVALFLAYGRPGTTWTVGGIEAGSAAAAAGLREGDRILSLDGQAVSEWEAFRSMLTAKAGAPGELVVERDGQELRLAVTPGWRLNADTAARFPSQPALTRDDLVVSADGQALARYDDLRQLLDQPGEPVTLRILRAGSPYDLVVERPYALPADGAAGFLGVRPQSDNVRETPVGAVGEAARSMGEGVTATAGVFGRLFSPSGLRDYAGQVADATQPTSTVAPSAPQARVLVPAPGSPAPTDAAPLNDTRPISIIGIAYLGSDAAALGMAAFFGLVAAVNLALALINLVPMLPFDGGHAAIAAYEGIRGRFRGAPYRADLTKLMPFVYGFFALIVLLGTSAMLLDVLNPPRLTR